MVFLCWGGESNALTTPFFVANRRETVHGLYCGLVDRPLPLILALFLHQTLILLTEEVFLGSQSGCGGRINTTDFELQSRHPGCSYFWIFLRHAK